MTGGNRGVTGDLVELRRQTLRALRFEFLAPRSGVELQVVIPAVEKDWPVLPLCISAARRRLKHPIRSITVVGPQRPPSWQAFAGKEDLFISEREVAPIRREDIDLCPGGVDRSGWLLQQLVKLSCDVFCGSPHVLVLDADTLFMRPQRMVKDGRIVLSASTERYPPYYEQIQRILPGLPIAPVSFVSHHVLFRTSVLKEMKAEIERPGKSWERVILDSLDKSDQSPFSEYELYGNYLLARHPQAVVVEHFLNVGAAPSRIDRVWLLKARLPWAKTISFHAR